MRGRQYWQCRAIPHRYIVTIMSSLAIMLAVGTRAAFALVMTHVTAVNQSHSILFQGCTVFNTSSDLRVDMGGDVMFLLHSVYYGSYTALIIPGSILSTVFSPKLVAGMAIGLLSLMSLLLPFIIPYSTTGVAVIRLIQGATEGLKQPSVTTIVALWSTGGEKARLFGILAGGSYIAPAIASVLTAIFLCYVSWSSIFFLHGGAGLVWMVVWWRWFHSYPDLHPSLSQEERQHLLHYGDSAPPSSIQLLRSVPWRKMLKTPGLWAILVAVFCRNLVFSLLVTQQPQYFMDAFNFRVEDIGVIAMVPFVCLAAMSVIGGVVSDALMRWGLPTTMVRKIIFSAGYGVEGLCLLALYWVRDWRTAFGLICTGVPIGGMASVAYGPLASDMAPQFTAIISGLALLGTLGGSISSAMASAIAGTTKTLSSWQTIYLVTGLFHLTGVLFFDLTADATRQPWAEVMLTVKPTNDESDSGDITSSDETSMDISYDDVLTGSKTKSPLQLEKHSGTENYRTLH